MEENQEKQKDKKTNKLFIFGAIALVVLLFVIALAEIISINSMNSRIKAQQNEIDSLTNQLNYYKDQEKNQTDDEVYKGTVE